VNTFEWCNAVPVDAVPVDAVPVPPPVPPPAMADVDVDEVDAIITIDGYRYNRCGYQYNGKQCVAQAYDGDGQCTHCKGCYLKPRNQKPIFCKNHNKHGKFHGNGSYPSDCLVPRAVLTPVKRN